MGNFESVHIRPSTKEIAQPEVPESKQESTYEEPGENLTAQAEVAEEEQEAIESKEEISSFGTQLLEHLTGLKIGDPHILERLIEDKQRIRAKYNLPPEAMAKIFPAQYESRLRDLAKEFKTDVRSKAEFEKFFEEHPYADAFNDSPEKRIVVDINSSESLSEYLQSLGILEHELIHAMQGVNSPGMPIEVQEYEAYLAANFHNLEMLRDDPEKQEVLDTLFTYHIGSSVNHWYQEESEKRKEEVRPDWEVLNPRAESVKD